MDAVELVVGQEFCRIADVADLGCHCRSRTCVVAGEHLEPAHGRRTLEPAHGLGGARAQGVRHRDRSHDHIATGHDKRRGTGRVHALDVGERLVAELDAEPLGEGGFADGADALRGIDAAHAVGRDLADAAHGDLGDPALMRARHDGAGERMGGVLLERVGDGEHIGFGGAVVPEHLDDLRLAGGERSGLVERHRGDLARDVEERAALHEHAHPRGARDGRDERDRRGDDERAGARHDEQRQRTVDPVVPDASGESRDETHDQRDADADNEGAAHDDGRVDRGEAVDEALIRRLLGLRTLHHRDDARERGAVLVGRDLDIDDARGVERAGEDLVARALVLRHRLARDGRLVERGRAAEDDAVERDALAG